MTLNERINADFITAFKEKDILKKNCLSVLKTKITEIGKKKDTVITDDDVVTVVASLVKQRWQTIDIYLEKQGKGEYEEGTEKNIHLKNQIEAETSEVKILEAYLPKQLTYDELKEKLIVYMNLNTQDATTNINASMGIIMKHFNAHYKGQFNNKDLKDLIERQLCK